MGLKKLPYWSANYTFDFLNLFVPYFIFLVIVLITGNPEFKKCLGYLTFGYLLFTFSFISYSYLISFMFNKSTTAFRTFPFFNLVLFYIIPFIIGMLDIDIYLAYLFFAPSPFVILQAIFFCKEVNPFTSNRIESIWYFYLVFLLQGFIYFGCVLAI